MAGSYFAPGFSLAPLCRQPSRRASDGPRPRRKQRAVRLRSVCIRCKGSATATKARGLVQRFPNVSGVSSAAQLAAKRDPLVPKAYSAAVAEAIRAERARALQPQVICRYCGQIPRDSMMRTIEIFRKPPTGTPHFFLRSRGNSAISLRAERPVFGLACGSSAEFGAIMCRCDRWLSVESFSRNRSKARVISRFAGSVIGRDARAYDERVGRERKHGAYHARDR